MRQYLFVFGPLKSNKHLSDYFPIFAFPLKELLLRSNYEQHLQVFFYLNNFTIFILLYLPIIPIIFLPETFSDFQTNVGITLFFVPFLIFSYRASNGKLIFEIGENQLPFSKHLLKTYGFYINEIHKDINKIPRTIVSTKIN